MSDLTIERLKEVVYLDETIWRFRWSHTKGSNAPKDKICGSNRSDEYTHFTIDGHRLLTHRMVWAYEHDRLPRKDEVIHHLDEDKSNNNPSNLSLMKDKEHKKYHSTGLKNPMYGKPGPWSGKTRPPMSKEQKQQIRETLKGRTGKLCSNSISVKVQGVIYGSMSEAGRSLGVSVDTVSKRCKGEFDGWSIGNI